MSILTTEALSALLTLTFLEIVLGIDNILFISLISNRLAEKDRKLATQLGLLLAMVLRIGLLMGISVFIGMQEAWFSIHTSFFSTDISGQSIILFLGGLFLIYKATKEIYERVEEPQDPLHSVQMGNLSLSKAIVQITLINIVFSFDSILTAIGMTNGLPNAFWLMVIAVVVSVAIMMLFANPVGDFVNKHPSLQVLGMAFLLLIGFMLLTEAGHLSHTKILDQEIGSIPKGYLYFAIAFSLGVEFINMRMRRKEDSV